MERPESFEGWMESVPRKIRDDALWQMVLYRQLLTLVPTTRGRKLAEEPTLYDAHPLDSLLTVIPYP